MKRSSILLSAASAGVFVVAATVTPRCRAALETPESGNVATTVESVRELVKKAKEEEKAGDLYAALETYREAHFLLPEDARLRAMVEQTIRKLSRVTFDEGEDLLEKGKEKDAAFKFKRSWAMAESRQARNALEKLGYSFYRGRWRTEAESRKFDAEDARLEVERKQRIGLATEFRAVRTDWFRVYTNMPEGAEWDEWLAPVLRVLESHFDQYRWTFQGDISLRNARQGLDVVFFKSIDEYSSWVAQKKLGFTFQTAGYYDPELEASFFYRDSGYGGLWRVLIHELTHQFNHEVLGAAFASWINEGLAVYFETATVGKDYKLTTSWIHHEYLSVLKSRGTLDGNYVALEQLMAARGIDDTKATGNIPVRQAYAHAWGWAYFLLHGGGKLRAMFREGVRREQKYWEEGAWEGSPGDVWTKLFRERGYDLSDLDEAYRKFYRELPVTRTSR